MSDEHQEMGVAIVHAYEHLAAVAADLAARSVAAIAAVTAGPAVATRGVPGRVGSLASGRAVTAAAADAAISSAPAARDELDLTGSPEGDLVRERRLDLPSGGAGAAHDRHSVARVGRDLDDQPSARFAGPGSSCVPASVSVAACSRAVAPLRARCAARTRPAGDIEPEQGPALRARLTASELVSRLAVHHADR
jgi:hypothetical protein